ncbi:MAG TPA: hypothetical protein DEA08_25360 [Planctomycetes bacterium]|nr:hypothetical protein [Planctomycetota bacterium]
MGDHEIAEEPEKDRAYASIVVVGLAIGLALVSWKSGTAAPNPRHIDLEGPRGSVVVSNGPGLKPRVEHGIVLVRGSAVHVLNADGETLVPRDQVIAWSATEDLSSEYSEPETARANPARVQRRGFGTVINREGAVFVGQLEVRPNTITVYSDERGSQTRVPRQDVRWWKIGVNGPDQDYWKKYGFADIDERFQKRRDGAAADTVARSHTLAQRWPEAAKAWTDLYLAQGDEESFDYLAHAVGKWTGSSQSVQELDAALIQLQQTFTREGELNDKLRSLLGKELKRAVDVALGRNDRRTAKSWAQRMVDLGGGVAVQGQEILSRLK